MSDADSATVLSGRGAARLRRRVVKPSDLEVFGEPGEIDAAVGGHQNHVLDPCRADGGIVEAGLDRDPPRGASGMSSPTPCPVPWKNPCIRPSLTPVVNPFAANRSEMPSWIALPSTPARTCATPHPCPSRTASYSRFMPSLARRLTTVRLMSAKYRLRPERGNTSKMIGWCANSGP